MNHLVSDVAYKTDAARFGIHFHTVHEVIFVTAGRMEITVGDRTFILSKNDGILLHNNEYHSLRVLEEPYCRYVLSLDPVEFSRVFPDPNFLALFKEKPTDASPVITVENASELIILFNKILTEKEKTQLPYTNLLLTALVQELLISFYRASHTKRVPHETDLRQRILEAQALLEANFSQPVTIDALCRQLHISRYYFTHSFTQLVGMSPKQYLMQIRMNHAGRLLSDSSLSVNEIGERCGFRDTNNFIRCFKIAFGTTPHQFRKKEVSAPQRHL